MIRQLGRQTEVVSDTVFRLDRATALSTGLDKTLIAWHVHTGKGDVLLWDIVAIVSSKRVRRRHPRRGLGKEHVHDRQQG